MSGLSWFGIARLGLVQCGIGAIVVLMTSTLNRVMVVELALPASLPAALVAWHYVLQLSRPRFGFGSDRGRDRAAWIRFGMAMLALGAVLAANATVLMSGHRLAGVALAVLAFALIGGGVAAAGTTLLALLAGAVRPERRPAAAAIAWIMMIAGIVLTAGLGGRLLDPYSPQRLVLVVSAVALTAVLLSLVALHGLAPQMAPPADKADFAASLRQLWRERLARDFTLFVFVSMLAYGAQELILEPFAGLVFDYSLGRSTQLAGAQHGGVLIGMVLVGLAGTVTKGDRTRFLRRCTLAGCLASALALIGLAAAALTAPRWPLAPMVLLLGLANGLFAVSAVGLMMSFAGERRGEGLRVGLWGAAQAIAFALGGFVGASGLDLLRLLAGNDARAFAAIFIVESLGFAVAASLALRLAPEPAGSFAPVAQGGRPS